MNNLLPLINGSIACLGDCRIGYDSVGRLRLRCDTFGPLAAMPLRLCRRAGVGRGPSHVDALSSKQSFEPQDGRLTGRRGTLKCMLNGGQYESQYEVLAAHRRDGHGCYAFWFLKERGTS